MKLKAIIGTFILMIFCMNIFPRILLNGSGNGYTSGDYDSGIKNTLSIETYVIQGAGYFLEANSCIQSILNRVELQDFNGIDYNELDRLVNRALQNITIAGKEYTKLIQLAEVTPYNQEFIFQLKSFDYRSFMAETGLNSVVFSKLRAYLEKGDITGTFKHTHKNLRLIRFLLISIKRSLYWGQLPELSILWKLNETCSEISLFGSYAARIFHAIH